VAPYQTQYEWAYLYSALEVDGDHAAQFLCLPEVNLGMSRLFLEHLAARDPEAEHIPNISLKKVATEVSAQYLLG